MPVFEATKESRLFRKGLQQFKVCDTIHNCDSCSHTVECLKFYDTYVVNEPPYRYRKTYLDTIVKTLEGFFK